MDLAQNEIINLKICSFKPKTEQLCTHSELGQDFQANRQLYCFPFLLCKAPTILRASFKSNQVAVSCGFFSH